MRLRRNRRAVRFRGAFDAAVKSVAVPTLRCGLYSGLKSRIPVHGSEDETGRACRSSGFGSGSAGVLLYHARRRIV